ncbi:hypothetical protein ERO13_A11G236700v2 [Gossypium hirsutum]|uniref:Knottin scorpion toxin-like domain-containing protein n=5 Tax=Gossypium TaxID=3633 RepID=A0A2P5Y1R3_GOSBA|nr:hypothetical protein ES319_A11G252300v1 [Gossypium barbadense]KAG4176301.1 hypothetical protein ERO13_A11G236700v2 [Gossypium hirsutum]KAK5785964.1 hypothetical protein PVK06_040588 [Gossypium arboreum]TYG95537.1 hypothetical protein ES288_A11G275600v1 [Gossypium darwinii]TYI02504.1 hypothetical protein ES332_A11G271600v1 [Gossypium tomentosum]TYJ11209.1 hypothetical protein E1A91_A11G259800v1 [Gossypium mustelinum]
MEKPKLRLACFIALLIIVFAMTEAEALADGTKGHPCSKHKDCVDACSYRGRCPFLCVSGSCVCDCPPP